MYIHAHIRILFCSFSYRISPFRSVLQEIQMHQKLIILYGKDFLKLILKFLKSITSYGQAFAQMCNYAQTILISPQQATQIQLINHLNKILVYLDNNKLHLHPTILSQTLSILLQALLYKHHNYLNAIKFFYNTTITASFCN